LGLRVIKDNEEILDCKGHLELKDVEVLLAPVGNPEKRAK